MEADLINLIYNLFLRTFPAMVYFGWLSAFIVFVFTLKPDSRWFSVFIFLGISSLLAPLSFLAIRWIVNGLSQQTIEIVTQLLMNWFEWWLYGIGIAFVWLRYIHSLLNVALTKLSRPTALERNHKTDVREISKYMPSSSLKFDPLKYVKLSKGVLIGLDEHRKPIYIQLTKGKPAPHIQVVGTTGSGKGIVLGVMASQFLELGEAVFFFDPKDDEYGPHLMRAAAQRLGKPYHFVNLNRPNGAQLNPFSGATEEEAFELFQAGLALTDKGDASDFYGIADRREAALTAKLISKKNLNIAQAFTARKGLMEGAEKFEGRLRELAETSSINALPGLGIDLAKVVAEGGCVYVVGSMRNDIIKTVQRLLLVRLIQLAEGRDRIAGNMRPVCIVLDEVKYYLSRPALEALGAARDKGVHVVLAHQALGDIRDCTSDLNPDAVVDAIVENCRIKICYQLLNPVTAEWMAAMSGEIQVDEEIRNVQKNFGQAEIVTGERNIRQSSRPYTDVNMLLNLPRGVAVVFGDGLAKFVSISPIKVAKTAESIEVHTVQGAATLSSADAIALD